MSVGPPRVIFEERKLDFEDRKFLNDIVKNLESIGVRDGMGGQGQYRVGRGSIGWAGAVSGGLGQY